ncbi:MAG: homogentisate 1,2-dioxygenase [Candidatus Zixiibacteriota bacterium]
MSFYHKLGDIPRVKHTTFLKKDGKSLFREELVSSKGFSGVYSTKYHYSMPTSLLASKPVQLYKDVTWPDAQTLCYHCFTDKKQEGGDFIRARNVFLQNEHCTIATCRVSDDTNEFYRNGYAAEYIFVHQGSGKLLSEYGEIDFGEYDQLVIPRATMYQLKFDSYSKDNKLLVIESSTGYEIPRHYRNDYGQLEEHAPYCERDIRPPQVLNPRDEKGEFRLILKAGDRYFEHVLPHHPFDVVGWDGYLYPYAFSMRDFHPKVARIHLPPPVHLAFITDHFVICNFVPRPFDFHEAAIPAPYYHFNIDSDEVLYYVDGDFMSRKGVVRGSITLHPGALPHGPQPGKTEASVGAGETREWAVMIDTFSPLRPTLNVKETRDEGYSQSWLE